MLRLHEAEAQAGRKPSRIVLHPDDYRRLAMDMRRYGFFFNKYLPRPLHVLQVTILDGGETAPDERTMRFEWSE